jgi:hypothetical protein
VNQSGGNKEWERTHPPPDPADRDDRLRLETSALLSEHNGRAPGQAAIGAVCVPYRPCPGFAAARGVSLSPSGQPGTAEGEREGPGTSAKPGQPGGSANGRGRTISLSDGRAIPSMRW